MRNRLVNALATSVCLYFFAMGCGVVNGEWTGERQALAQEPQKPDVSLELNQQLGDLQQLEQASPQGKGEAISQSEAEEEDLPEWKSIGPLRPGSDPYKEIAGTWEGEYSAYNTKYELTLEIGKRGKESVAIFIFQRPKKRKQSGSFEMKCEYSPKNKIYTLSGKDWLEHPRNYHMLDMTGTIEKGVFRGEIFNVNGDESIGKFKLERNGEGQ